METCVPDPVPDVRLFLLPSSAVYSAHGQQKWKNISKSDIKVEGEPGAWMVLFQRPHPLPYRRSATTGCGFHADRGGRSRQCSTDVAACSVLTSTRRSTPATVSTRVSVVSVLTHPCRNSTESQLLDAMRRVAKLAGNLWHSTPAPAT